MHEKRHERITADDDQRRATRTPPREPRYDLAKLVAGMTPENAHPEVDWGEARGRRGLVAARPSLSC